MVAQAEEVDGLPPGVRRVLDRLQPGVLVVRTDLQLADEPGEGSVGQFGRSISDLRSRRVRASTSGARLCVVRICALLQDVPFTATRLPDRPLVWAWRRGQTQSAAKSSAVVLPHRRQSLAVRPADGPAQVSRGGKVVVARVQRPAQRPARDAAAARRHLLGEGAR